MNLTDNKLVIYCPTPAVKRAAQLVAMDYGYRWGSQRGNRSACPQHCDTNNQYLVLRLAAYGHHYQLEGHRYPPAGFTPVETLNELVQWLSHGTP